MAAVDPGARDEVGEATPAGGEVAAAARRSVDREKRRPLPLTKNSVSVQRGLARRLVDAQTRWLPSPTSTSSARSRGAGLEDDGAGKREEEGWAEGEGGEDGAGGAGGAGVGVFDGFGSDSQTILEEAWARGQWLLGLLVLQSTSSAGAYTRSLFSST